MGAAARRVGAACLAAAAAWVAASPAGAATAIITASKDNTLYSNDGALSDGSGTTIYSGATFSFGDRRAVMCFDISANIAPGSTIASVQLTLRMTKSAPGSGNQTMSLHRLLSSWGEGTSDAGNPGGDGALASPGDATWTYRYFDTTPWSTPGGDFAATASGSATVGAALGIYTWGSTAGMVSDAQTWLTSPASNMGWILIGNESATGTAKEFVSREGSGAGSVPTLTVLFGGAPFAAGVVPNGGSRPGQPLTVDKAAGGQVKLDWGPSCATGDTDYAVYEGTIVPAGAFDNHVQVTCSTAGARTSTFTPGAGDRYYLVVPRKVPVEGSYGTGSDSVERGQGASSCVTQVVGICSCR